MGEVTWGNRSTSSEAEGSRPAARTIDEFVFARGAEVSIVLPDDLYARVAAGCAAEGVNLTEVVVELLQARFPRRPFDHTGADRNQPDEPQLAAAPYSK